MKRRNQGITKLKSRYGLLFVTPWLIGFVLFFAMPAIQSILYSFSDVQLTGEGLQISLVGLKHYRYALLENPNYVTNMWSSVGTILYSLPFILLISLVLALILNQKFRGRLFFRALFFLPVIISTGIVLNLMFLTTGSDMTGASASESLTGNMFSVADVISVLNLPAIGKSMTFRLVGITAEGKRILRFDHDRTRRHSPIIDRMGEIYIVENKSVAAYLRQLEKMGEDAEDYASIWGYTHGQTEPRFGLYVYPDFPFGVTDRVSNLELE